ncbi:SurA N-terminal domain-containing protein [Candidatus Saccharibacteria bacterium]|nr:SurA N-terminal domain-containing protein [Candidatus Saccharibacteria bacterium]
MLKKIKAKKNKLQQKIKDRKKTPLETGESVGRVTNKTVAEHREEVIGNARKYIYPLQHSKHRIVIVSITLFIAAFVAFVGYTTLALYKFKSHSTFTYKVTQVIPFPIARIGREFVSYENYLFELRRYVHYYETQGKLDFDDPKNKEQLDRFKQDALNKVINDAYIKKLAKQSNITVSSDEVDQQVALLREQNRLGNSDRVFEDVLADFWGWTIDDFKRSLKQEMLAQKLLSSLDTENQDRASKALAEIKGGADFSEVAKNYSDDENTKANGGEFGFPVDRSSKVVNPYVVNALFKLKPGETSEIVNTGYKLVIVKNIETNGDKVRGAIIEFNFKDVNDYLNNLKEQQPTRAYVKN